MGIRDQAVNGEVGVVITRIVSKTDTHATTKSEKIIFKMGEKKEYKDNFLELVKEDILSDCKYDDHKWTGIGNSYNRNLDFESFEYNKKIYEALKAYCIFQLYHKRITIDTVNEQLNHIKKAINVTQNFKKEYIEKFDDFLDEYTEHTTLFIITSITYYLLFNPVNKAKEYLQILSTRPEWDLSTEPRELPSVTSVLVFSDILENYMATQTESNRAKYFPIYLWWRITNIIPMRPSEFIRTKKDCTYTKDNKYYLRIGRKKRRPNELSKKRVVPLCDEIEINKEIYDLIEEYRELTNIQDEEYLLALKVYTDYRNYKGLIEYRSTFKDRFNEKHLGKLLDEFYEEAVVGKYKVVSKQGNDLFEDEDESQNENDKQDENEDESQNENENSITKINLGDTRHFAFCSLMLQGFNPLAIAALGGHKSLESQMNYHRHLDSYISCQTYLLKQVLKQKMSVDGLNGNVKTSRELALQSYNENIPVLEVDGGWCCSMNFPNECTSIRCVRCSKFKLDFNRITDKVMRELNLAEEELNEEIATKIKFVQRYYSTNISELKDRINDEELKKDSTSLSKSVMQKARIVAMKEKIAEV